MPDPAMLGKEQYKWTKRAADDSAERNAIDQYAPWGSTTYERNDQGVPTGQRIELGDSEQDFYDTTGTKRNEFLGNLSTGNFRAPAAMRTGMPGDQFSYSQGANQIRTMMPTDKFSVDPSISGMKSGMPTDTFSAPDESRVGDVESALYKRRLGLVDQDLKAADDRKRQELTERGIPVGAEIYNDEQNRLDESRGNTLAGIAQDATLAAGAESDRLLGHARGIRDQQFGEASARGSEQNRLLGNQLAERNQLFSESGQRGLEQNRRFANELGLRDQRFDEAGARGAEDDRRMARALTVRNQPFNEYASFMSGSPMQTPQFKNDPAYQMQAPDVTSGAYSNYNTQLGQYNNQNNSMWSGIMGLGSAALPFLTASDARAKKDIERLGETDGGTPLYKFRYKNENESDPVHIGPMAQEVEETNPEAVWAGPMGLKMVDYAMVQ